MKASKFFLLIVTLSLLTFSCSKTDNTTDPDPSLETQGDLEDLQESVVRFGLAAFQKAFAEGEENVLISPLSLESALYMTMNGANGNTLEEMRSALKVDSFYPNGINKQYPILIDKLKDTNSKTTFGSENTVFYDGGLLQVFDDFKNNLEDAYEVDFTNVPFANPSTVDLINGWAEEATEGRIKEVLKEIRSDEVMFLLNALYFKGDWEKGFHPESTYTGEFTKEDGSTVDVNLMISDDTRDYYIGNDFSAVDFKFTDSEYSMSFIIPSEGQNITDFVTNYKETELYDLYESLYTDLLANSRVQVRLPKFEMSNKIVMTEMLKEMGMVEAFDEGKADLTKLGTAGGRLYISRVLHDTFLKIDEKGAEGAAVTTVGVGVESVPPSIDFTSPFLFIIRHVETNAIVFIGKCGLPE